MEYRFCESVYATYLSKWHIREVEDGAPKKYGGGADAPLCYMGDAVKRWDNGWDLEVEVTEEHLHGDYVCPRCLELMRKKAR
jgi:hypothetical protein